MVIDTLSNAGKYSCLHPLFGKAFEYIQSQDLETIAPGNYEIDGDSLKAAVFDKIGKTKAESLQKFECHNKYIDIQVCIRGNEQIGWKPRQTCHDLKVEYNPEKDVSFYNDEPDMYFQLTGQQFVIFFPEDVHAPMISEGEVKKLVIKVKV
ncbi:YhcH/YjgK/YiaL family protein [Negadavirga shengliensis]|uniref:YhcH/YjgK/YiaL family protein n=1 Tax=Negadavirga shengliensis TaxID=1389218 RepID=A0ABV9T5Z4_9BACT